jgi:hypothetical protein
LKDFKRSDANVANIIEDFSFDEEVCAFSAHEHFLHMSILISIVHCTLNIQMPLDLLMHPKLGEIGSI